MTAAAMQNGNAGLGNILLVEDDAQIASGLVYALEEEGYAVTHSRNVAEAWKAVAEQTFHLAILDMNLPDGTGFDVRGLLSGDTRVIFLTVVDDEPNILRAFENGAEDYVTKPFRLRELLARVRRVLKPREKMTLGGVSIDPEAGKAYLNGSGAAVELTALEYRLLLTFAANKGKLLTRAQILDGIWDATGNFVEDNTLTVYVKRLREKLQGFADIETVRGVGYRVD